MQKVALAVSYTPTGACKGVEVVHHGGIQLGSTLVHLYWNDLLSRDFFEAQQRGPHRKRLKVKVDDQPEISVISNVNPYTIGTSASRKLIPGKVSTIEVRAFWTWIEPSSGLAKRQEFTCSYKVNVPKQDESKLQC